MYTKIESDIPPSQETTDDVWRGEWERDRTVKTPLSFFKQRLFVEGYPVFKRHIPESAESILDVGSGTGRYGVMFAKDFPNARVTVTDILPEALDIGRGLAKELGVQNVTFAQEDVLQMSFSDGSFDVVFCDVVLQHVPDADLALRELLRVLKPGGVLVVSSVNSWNWPHAVFKMMLQMYGKPYPYGYEHTLSPLELKRFMERISSREATVDGFYFAYGIYRLKIYHSFFAVFGKITNRFTRIIDRISDRFVSRYFGFEVFCVVKK